ncbi:unnamed protein product [Cuscuta europaea]|uniref:Uncharacterized protein n=1 Tax=Cuscuta europaea TaxID=41803 RepID=A0A9P0Z5M9_CUSEU|nr:unnamed protein product [Cuscuta europaea]
MVKTAAGGSALAVHYTKKKRRSAPERRRSFKKKVFDYLFSDDYMFAPLLSLQSSIVSSSSSAGIEEPLAMEKEEEDFVEKVGDYMRSDCYLYSPMVITQPWLASSVQCQPPATKTELHHILEKKDMAETGELLKEGDQTDHPVEKISIGVFNKDQNTDSCHPFDLSRTRIKSTSLRQETVKHVIFQHSRPLTP